MPKRRKSSITDKKAKGNGKTKAAPAPSVAGTTAGSNLGVRADILRTAFREIYELDREEAAAKAKHVKPIQEAKAERKKMLRNDLDAKAADINPLYAIYKRDHDLAAFESEDDAKKSQDMMREAFEVLSTGSTLNFLDVFGVSDDRPPAGARPQTSEAHAAGYDAGREGKNADHNPYEADSNEAIAWEQGRGRGMLANVPGQSEGAAAN